LIFGGELSGSFAEAAKQRSLRSMFQDILQETKTSQLGKRKTKIFKSAVGWDSGFVVPRRS